VIFSIYFVQYKDRNEQKEGWVKRFMSQSLNRVGKNGV